MKHEGFTPGPWAVIGRKDINGRTMPHIDIDSPSGLTVAYNVFVRDAELIAAAPSLLAENERLRAALERLLPAFDNDSVRVIRKVYADRIAEAEALLSRP